MHSKKIVQIHCYHRTWSNITRILHHQAAQSFTRRYT